MQNPQADTIYPCPFSKNYGIPSRQAWLLLKIFALYRFVLSSLFVILLYSRFSATIIETGYKALYSYTSKAYLILAILFGILSFCRWLSYTLQSQSVIFSDIIIITLLMHACGGIDSGIGILLTATIASAGLLIGGRCSTVFAALATVVVLGEQVYAIQNSTSAYSLYPMAGMLGASFFTIALLSYTLANRSEQSDLLANQQQQTISILEELNKYIIQHLQSGIIICNKQQQVYMANQAALSLLEQEKVPRQLDEISSHLGALFQVWLTNKTQDIMLLQCKNQTNVYLRFNLLPTKHEMFYMAILEDIALYNQRLQQGVLASLGRLTASIAHEIRNPLGAISHASQLLAENPQLNPQDLRLTEIIQKHSDRVNKIIDDILQSSRRRPSKREKIYLDQWLPEYLNNFMLENDISETEFNLNFINKDLCVLMDGGHLRQILDNLCHNALKYGRLGHNPISLQANVYRNSPCISVINNGVLLNDDIVAHLFEPFFTSSSTGTGLGLYISRELAELNQANLTYVVTENQQSSAFRLCLANAEYPKIEI